MLDFDFYCFIVADKYVTYTNRKEECEKHTNMLIITCPWIYSGLWKFIVEYITNVLVTLGFHATNYFTDILQNFVDLLLGEIYLNIIDFN
jgi:hypothetical protein